MQCAVAVLFVKGQQGVRGCTGQRCGHVLHAERRNAGFCLYTQLWCHLIITAVGETTCVCTTIACHALEVRGLPLLHNCSGLVICSEALCEAFVSDRDE